MRRNRTASRILATASAGLVLALVSTLPASATPKGEDDSHKTTICHVTNSQRNPYVIIEIDVSAFDGEGKTDHTHHVSKDGRIDVLYADGECQVVRQGDTPTSPSGGDVPTPPPVGDVPSK